MKEVATDLRRVGAHKALFVLFPLSTQIVGFTAWSSMREPSQVFCLLESVYHEFDKIAQQKKVFKVETIGDCYVAVCGKCVPTAACFLLVAKTISNNCIL